MREFVRLRLSKQDKEFLQVEAKKNRMSLSSYVRTMLNIKGIFILENITLSLQFYCINTGVYIMPFLAAIINPKVHYPCCIITLNLNN